MRKKKYKTPERIWLKIKCAKKPDILPYIGYYLVGRVNTCFSFLKNSKIFINETSISCPSSVRTKIINKNRFPVSLFDGQFF